MNRKIHFGGIYPIPRLWHVSITACQCHSPSSRWAVLPGRGSCADIA